MDVLQFVMRKVLILILITTAVLVDESKAGDSTFEWKSSSLFPNGTVVQACAGDNVTFPWVLDMTSSAKVSIEWSKTSEDKPDQEEPLVLASYSGDAFYGLELDRDLKFLPNAGIMLPMVTPADTGLYKVEIIVLGHPKLYKQVAFLHVSDTPVITSDELNAFIFPESIYKTTTGLWHVHLGCRPPVTRGQSALPVIWTTPSNRTAISTSYSNNTFILALPSPLEEGNYSCSLNSSVPAVKCLSAHLNTRRAATVNVKGVNTRLSDLDRSVETLWIEAANLNGSLCNLSDIVQHLQSNDKKCDERIINLNQTTENMYSVLQNLKTENDKMTSKTKYLEITTATARIKYDNMSVLVLNKFDNLTDVIQRKNSSMTVFVQSKFDGITAMVQNNNNSITAMVKSMSAMVQRNNDSIASMVQSKFDNITAMVQSKIDNITAMVQSKFDNVNAIVLQLRSGLIQLLGMDNVIRPSSCVEVQKFDNVSGVHTLIVNDNRPIKVYCDQSTDNGGWTVIQRRQDGSVDFYRNWTEYENGFGDLNGEFWIGLANLYYLTTNKTSKLRVDLTDFGGSTAYAMYNTFNISGAQDYYRLNVGGYTGTAGESMSYHNKMRFSTFDQDRDNHGSSNCAQLWHGAWWYNECHQSNLNGLYKSSGVDKADGVNWRNYKKDYRSFKRVEMKIKQ